MSQLIPITTTRLGEHLPLLDLLPDTQPLAWIRSGEGLVGWGIYASTTVSGPHRFSDARHWWQKQLEKFEDKKIEKNFEETDIKCPNENCNELLKLKFGVSSSVQPPSLYPV